MTEAAGYTGRPGCPCGGWGVHICPAPDVHPAGTCAPECHPADQDIQVVGAADHGQSGVVS